jgi:hypothetical protein
MINQTRERKLRELEAKAAKDRERQELLRLHKIARLQASLMNGKGGKASINLVTEDMIKRVKVEKLPTLIENATISTVLKSKSNRYGSRMKIV